MAGAKVNFDKSEGLRLGAWRGGVPLPGPFRWSYGPVRILGAWFGLGLQLERNWLEILAKVKAQVGTWLRRRLSLKGRAEVCAVYIFPLILYRLSVLPLPREHRVALEQSLFKLLWSKSIGPLTSLLPTSPRWESDLESHWLAEILAYLGQSLMNDTVWGLKVRNAFSRLRSNPSAESRRRPRDEAQFVFECRRAICNLSWSGDLSQSRKEPYRGLVVGSVSDPLVKRLDWSLEEIFSQWNWAPGSSFLNNELSLTWRLGRNALALNDWAYRTCIIDMPDCPHCGSRIEETALHAICYCERVRPFWSHVVEWTAHISPKQLVLLIVGYVVDNVNPPFQGKKRVVFLAILAVARMVIWRTRNKGLYDGAKFSHRDLILFFRHPLRVQIRCDRKRLDRITFSKRWVYAASMVVRKGANVWIILPSSSWAWWRWSGSFLTSWPPL